MTDISPVDDLEELWNWEKRTDLDESRIEPMAHFRAHSGPQILVCHDMKGGYLEEETREGKQFDKEKYPFTFLNWWQIDVFNYFSHHFVTIPPEEYTRVAHKHGVLSLGTFITEWIPGGKLCEKILESEDSVERTVVSLVAVARHFGFDGWLINVENEIEEDRIDLLIRFCSLLTEKSKKSNEKSRVIWYDSVLHNGKLKWQNALNHQNRKFYEACDAIYLNYNWTDHHLLKSAELGSLDRIYVGIDVWARGCVGEFQCHRSFALAKLFRMSVALFAPGWIFEKFPDENQIVKGIEFWQRLYPHVKTRPLTQINLSTNFCSGMDNDWRFRLSSMQMQPQCLSPFCHPVVGKGLVLFGRRQKFTPLFTFTSIPFQTIQITCQSDHSVNFTWNRIEVVEKAGDSTWTIKGPGALESLEMLTADHDETAIHFLSISNIE